MQPHRRQGFGRQALDLLADYALQTLHLHQLYAVIAADNEPALQLFSQSGFVRQSVLREWLQRGHEWVDAVLMQRFL